MPEPAAEFTSLHIDGRWTPPAAPVPLTDVLGAADGTVVGRVPAGGAADVDRAVAAARSPPRSPSRSGPR